LVNSIVHPVVINYLKKEIQNSKEKVIIVEAALIFESSFDKMLDYVITVYSNKKTRIRRLMNRDGSKKSEIERISKFQMDERKKIKKSDFVIVNNNTEKYMQKQVELIGNILNTLK